MFATFPNDMVTHLKCFTDKHLDPMTGYDFRIKVEKGDGQSKYLT